MSTFKLGLEKQTTHGFYSQRLLKYKPPISLALRSLHKERDDQVHNRDYYTQNP